LDDFLSLPPVFHAILQGVEVVGQVFDQNVDLFLVVDAITKLLERTLQDQDACLGEEQDNQRRGRIKLSEDLVKGVTS